MRYVLVGVFLSVAAAFSVAVPSHAQDADEVFDRLKDKYESIEALRAEFSQTMSSSYMDEQATSYGVLVASGDKYRVETEGQTLVTDGEVTWVYMPSQQQVLINDYSEDEQTFSVSEFLFDYEENFELSDVKRTSLDGEQHFVLTLEPKKDDAFFTEATLSMRDRDDVVTRLQVVDVNGTTMVFRLTNIQINPKLDSGIFSFTPPKGAEVVDLRS